MAQDNTPRNMSPRQRMINLMYIVLTAMLALNVSSDVLQGFTQVNDGLVRSNDNVGARNDAVYRRLEAVAADNPRKGERWYSAATDVRVATRRLYSFVDSLKQAIVLEADGKNGDLRDIKKQEDFEAVSVVMLNPVSSQGRRLRERIGRYRAMLVDMTDDSAKRADITAALATDAVAQKGSAMSVDWETGLFDGTPAIAAITLLSKIQNYIRFAEGETLTHLLSKVDAGDLRVNSLNAFVIPQSRNVMRGDSYSADIVLAAVDTTRLPAIYMDGVRLAGNGGHIDIPAMSPGLHTHSGYLEVTHDDGTVSRHEFSPEYTVVEPSATVSATMMNVFYAGIDNPVDISVPSVEPSAVSATMTGGTLSRSGRGWVARPSKVGSDVVITVTADVGGRKQTVAKTTFHVRKLPDPAPYIALDDTKGHTLRYRGSKPIAKPQLMAASGIGAAIDDGMLDIACKVLGFETVFFDSMGNAMPEVSDGASFSRRQKEAIKRMSRGKRFFISRVRALGPDGIERDIAPMEVIIN